MKRQQAIDAARAEVGTKEEPKDSNCVKYNDWLYKRTVSGPAYPWCAAFVSWIFKGTGLVKETASCVEMAQFFKNINRWSRTPEPGDIVFFKYGTNSRWTNHVGIVTAVNGSQITTIEGNTSTGSAGSQDNGGCVAERKRTLKNVVGFGRPCYMDAAPITDHSTLKVGSKGPEVKILQGLLNQNGAKLAVDGEFGPATKEAVKAYQREHHLEIDGVVGALTWAALQK